MKKWLLLMSLVLITTFIFTGCSPKAPDVSETPKTSETPKYGPIGNPKTFEKDDFKILLTDRFIERPPREGFYACYDTHFIGIHVLRDYFSLAPGASDLSVEQYSKLLASNNPLNGAKSQCIDGLWCVIYENDYGRGYIFTYKGADAFWSVEYFCSHDNVEKCEDLIITWAKAVEVK